MKELPACQTCVNSEFLCSSCQEKLDSGEITEFEIELAKELLQLEEEEPEEFGFLKDISFLKAIDYEDVVILVVGKNDKLKITPELLKLIKISYEIEKIILIEQTKNPRAVVDSLISPSKSISLNEIFLATGDVQYKAVIPKDEKEDYLFTKEELEDLIHELTGNITRIEYE
jgi:transcription antitermination factor NusA-like protein